VSGRPLENEDNCITSAPEYYCATPGRAIVTHMLRDPHNRIVCLGARVALRTGGILGSLLLVQSCYSGGVYGPLGATCPALNAPDPFTVHVSSNAVADGKVRTFVASARDLVNVSLQMESEVLDACRRMANDLGIGPAEMAPRNSNQPGAAAQAACAAVSSRIDAMLRQGAQLQVQVVPPQCQANLQAKAYCDGACSVAIDPGRIVAECEPARLSGFCSGNCQGQCDTNCRGQCVGQCQGSIYNGQCMGHCEGVCRGSCDGTCHAYCQGNWQSPQCQGYVQPPNADAECNASCSAQADFRGYCTPPQVYVRANQNFDATLRLAQTLQANLPELIHAELALGRRLAGSGRVLVSVGSQLPNVLGDAGAQALACVAAASSGVTTASMRIDVSIQASASVTGRVGAGAGR